MTSTQLAQLEDEELLERVRVAPSTTCAELANRFEAQQGLIESYEAIGPVATIITALVAARRASLLLDLHATQCKEVVEDTKRLDDALGLLNFSEF